MGKILILSVTDHEEHRLIGSVRRFFLYKIRLQVLLPVLLEKNIYKFDKRQSTLPQIDYLQF